MASTAENHSSSTLSGFTLKQESPPPLPEKSSPANDAPKKEAPPRGGSQLAPAAERLREELSADSITDTDLELPPQPKAECQVRNSLSVSEEAHSLKETPFTKASNYLSSLVNTYLLSASNPLAGKLSFWLRRFSELPRKVQLSLAAAPYLLLALLTAGMLWARSANKPAPPKKVAVASSAQQASLAPASPVAADKKEAKPATTAPAEIVPGTKEPHQTPAEETASKQPALVAPRAKVPAAAETQPQSKSETIVLKYPSLLFVRPSSKAKAAAKLRAGRSITIYPDTLPNPHFVLASTGKGTVGYLSKLHAEGEKDPRVKDWTKKRRRRRRRRY